MSFVRVVLRAANGALKEVEHHLNGKSVEDVLKDIHALHGHSQTITKAVHFFTDKDGNQQQRHVR